MLIPQSLQFVGRSGQQDDDSRPSLEFGLQPLSRRRAAGVRQHDRALQHVGLLRVVVRHLQPSLREALVHRGDDFVVALQLHAQGLGDRLAREIVLGGAKSAHEDGDVGAADCGARYGGEVLAVVAHDGLEGNADSQFIEAAGEEEGIGVLPRRGQHLRADGDNFRDHEFSLAVSTWQLAFSHVSPTGESRYRLGGSSSHFRVLNAQC